MKTLTILFVSTLLSTNLIAQVYINKDRVDELIAAWKKSIKVKVDTYGENHEKVLNDYFSLYDDTELVVLSACNSGIGSHCFA